MLQKKILLPAVSRRGLHRLEASAFARTADGADGAIFCSYGDRGEREGNDEEERRRAQ